MLTPLKTLPYDPTRVPRRRKYIVTQSQLRRNDFAKRQYSCQNVFLLFKLHKQEVRQQYLEEE